MNSASKRALVGALVATALVSGAAQGQAIAGEFAEVKPYARARANPERPLQRASGVHASSHHRGPISCGPSHPLRPIGPRLRRQLELGERDQSIVVLGDSTGDQTTEWVYRVAQALGTRYPAYRVEYAGWMDRIASWIHRAAYDSRSWWPTGTVVQPGNPGTVTLEMWNGSVAGTREDYPVGTRLKTIVTDNEPDLVFISYGHNSGPNIQQFALRYQALVDRVQEAVPDTELALIAQNPSTHNTWQQQRAVEISRIADLEGAAFVNVCQAFVDTGNVAAFEPDGVHPNAAGQALWQNTVMAQM